MVSIHFLNVTHNLLLTHYGDLNASVSTTGAINAYFQFSKDVKIFVRVIVNFDSNNLSVNFMNKTVSWCKVIEAPRYEPLIKIAYKIFSRKSHLPQKCPIEKVTAKLWNELNIFILTVFYFFLESSVLRTKFYLQD